MVLVAQYLTLTPLDVADPAADRERLGASVVGVDLAGQAVFAVAAGALERLPK